MATATQEQKEGATLGGLRIRLGGGLVAEECNVASPVEVSKEPDAVLPKPRLKQGEMASRGEMSEATTETSRRFEPEISPLIRLVPGQAPQRSFKMLQQWEGVVTAVEKDSFWADIRDLTDSNNPPEIVRLGLSEVSDADRGVLEQGVAFYWSIGYEQSPAGQRRRTSEIRVRRTPEWSKKSVESIKIRAAELLMGLSDNGEEDSTGR
jgi:hypothetical protein